jgi:hypothetical protein
MAQFNQTGQHVGYQYNADTINFGGVQNRAELTEGLERLQGEIDKATRAGVFDAQIAGAVENHISKAIQETKSQSPDKKSILDHLGGVSSLIKGVSAAGSLAGAVMEAIKIVHKFF